MTGSPPPVQLHSALAPLAQREPEGHLFKQLLERMKFYAGFEINDQTGSSLTDHEMTDAHYDKITSLQVTCGRGPVVMVM